MGSIKDSKPNRKPQKLELMTKEQIRQAIVKRRECNVKALAIVESLLDGAVPESHFISCLPNINQSHLDDIIEERNIIQLCGYPLCAKTLSANDIPKQKYRISVKTNKVYDITARKNFCSNSCYEAAMHVKKQMLISPLWFREYDEVPTFNLLPLSTTGSLGEEVDVAIIKRVKKVKPKVEFTSVNDFASATLDEIGDTKNLNGPQKENLDKLQQLSEECKEENENTTYTCEKNTKPLSENDEYKNLAVKTDERAKKDKVLESNAAAVEATKENVIKDQPNKKSNSSIILGDVIEKPEQKIDPTFTSAPYISNNLSLAKSGKKIPKKAHSVTAITIEVEKCLAEWFTLDTLLFLFSEDKVKEIVKDKGEQIKEYLNNYSRSIFYSSNTDDHYQSLYRKLHMLELEDRQYDSQNRQSETKPMPDYSVLQEEGKNLKIKVKAFFDGQTDIPGSQSSEEKSEFAAGDEITTQLPLVDKNAKNALRRKIVCQQLTKVLPDVLRSLGLLTLSISSDVRLLVNTFKLRANNIMFKPIQWTLIAIVIIKLLSIRDIRLRHLLGQATAFQHMQLLLLSYKQDGGYLDRLISWLTDIDRLLDTNDKQLTIE